MWSWGILWWKDVKKVKQIWKALCVNCIKAQGMRAKVKCQRVAFMWCMASEWPLCPTQSQFFGLQRSNSNSGHWNSKLYLPFLTAAAYNDKLASLCKLYNDDLWWPQPQTGSSITGICLQRHIQHGTPTEIEFPLPEAIRLIMSAPWTAQRHHLWQVAAQRHV